MNNRIMVEDFRNLIKGLKVAYPRDNFIPNEYTFNLWYTTLQDIPYPTLRDACTRYIMSNKYPPTIADIRQLAYDVATPPESDAPAAWNQLIRALRMAYAPESVEIWEGLPEITKRIIGGYAAFKAWGNTELSSLETVQRPMFLKRYEEYKRREREEMAMPEALRQPLPALPKTETTAQIEAKEQGDSIPAPHDLMEELRRRLA